MYFHWNFLPSWLLVAPKRSKKDRDRTWECEEKDRRGSGEHRRSGGHHDSRRGSGSRYRECSPVDSEEDSPPPSLSDRKWLDRSVYYVVNVGSFVAKNGSKCGNQITNLWHPSNPVARKLKKEKQKKRKSYEPKLTQDGTFAVRNQLWAIWDAKIFSNPPCASQKWWTPPHLRDFPPVLTTSLKTLKMWTWHH